MVWDIASIKSGCIVCQFLPFSVPTFCLPMVSFSVSSVLRSLIATFIYGNRLGRLRTRGLVVMTSPLQGEGRRFNPGRVHSFLHQWCLELYIVHRQYYNFARLC